MIKAPKYLVDHLSKSSRKFFLKIMNQFELEDHHLEILSKACECIDRITESRLRIDKDGPYFEDRFGQLKPHPALKTEEQNKIIFLRLIKDLGLDIEPGTGEVGRPPGYK